MKRLGVIGVGKLGLSFALLAEHKGYEVIGSEEMVSINELAQMAIDISGKDLKIKNIEGQEFVDKYGFVCPIGVRGRNSDNKLYKEK